MRIDDYTGQFTEDEKQELENFVRDNLLSTELDLEWLDVVKIQERGMSSGYSGYWTGGVIYKLDSEEIIGFRAEIILNYSFVKVFKNDPIKRLNKLKEVLAHEYGHHWTLSYLLFKKIITNFATEHLPQEYYKLRDLNKQEYTPFPSSSSFESWCLCDKEVIAEDYRVLFASNPHNQDHVMVINSNLLLPDESVKNYINDLPLTDKKVHQGLISKLKEFISRIISNLIN